MRLSGGHKSLNRLSRPTVSHAVPDLLLGFVVAGIGSNLEKIVMNRTDIPIDGYVVIIENNEDVRLAGSGIIQAFKC